MNGVHRLVGPALLVVALATFIAFHFLPVFGWERGWEIWRELAESIVQPRFLKGILPVAYAIFSTFAACVICAPFGIPLIRRSGLAERFFVLVSALVLLPMGFIFFAAGESRMESGEVFLLLSAWFHFAGVLIVRYEGAREDSRVDFPGD